METNTDPFVFDPALDEDQLIEPVEFRFGLNRRAFVQVMSAGLMIVAGPLSAQVQRETGERRGRRGRGRGRIDPSTRLHIAPDGRITVFAGKVEIGQGARAELTQAAAEELRVAPGQIEMILSDTGRVPNDGLTAGSRTTPSTVPAVRQATAMAREILATLAAEKWGVEQGAVRIADGRVTNSSTQSSLTYGDLAQGDDLVERLKAASASDVQLTETRDFKVLGSPLSRPNAREIVTGTHHYAYDTERPGMLHGKVLRAPSYGAKLVSIDLEPARSMKDVVVVRDGDFVGVCAPTSYLAKQALEAIARTAKWETTSHPASSEVFDYLRRQARERPPANPFADEVAAASKKLRQTYHVAYIQHAPMEPRCGVAEWQDGKLTVWATSSNPFGVQNELRGAFRIGNDQVRVIVPDSGGSFGGKHTGEAAVEAARLAQGAGKPVSLKWTREEEFTWAYFRPAAVIDVEASLDDRGRMTSWHFININSGRAAMDTPYDIAKKRSDFIGSDAPLRQGSYRSLAAAANNFARETFMDELAGAADQDPLEFRLAHLGTTGTEGRLRDVLQAAAKRFNWQERVRQTSTNTGIGISCGFDKNSVVATIAEVTIDPQRNTIAVRKACQAFECGTILNPTGLRSQVEGGLLMGIGPALREEIRFAGGAIQNPRFSQYAVPRFSDVPELDIVLLNRPDQPSVGAGETPMIGIAPAIANAVHHATGKRIHAMPIRLG